MKEDTEPHVLVIEHVEDMVEWHVEHLPSCPQEEVVGFHDADFEQKHEPMLYYTCRVQAVIDGNGIDDIDDWRELPSGRYEIKSYYDYWPGEFGGSYGEEHEIGIFLVKG